jgi:hypothetical protein
MSQILDVKPQPFAPLVLQDRCDRCGAQAFVRVARKAFLQPGMFDPNDLIFCGHHYGRHELELMQQGFVLMSDQRAEINAKPGGSAAA